jgi:hypothetical protein
MIILTSYGCNNNNIVKESKYEDCLDLCDRLEYIKKNPTKFLQEDSLVERRLIDLSKETKISLTIPELQHYGNEASLKSQSSLLRKQVSMLIDSLCLMD